MMCRRGARVAVLVVAFLAVLGGLGAYGLSGDDSLVYYQTPGEFLDDPPAAERQVRLGGLVVDGSIERDGDAVRFVLTDGVADVEVRHDGEVRGVFQEGQGALVEGRPDGAGGFRSELLMVQHDNTYEAGDGEREAYEAPDAGQMPEGPP